MENIEKLWYLKDLIKTKKANHPALMKGFIDRTFLPGITYQPIKEKALLYRLLKSKIARLIITADTTKWYDFLIMKRPVINQFKKGTLEFCRITPVKVTYISPIKNSSEDNRNKWLNKISFLGENLK